MFQLLRQRFDRKKKGSQSADAAGRAKHLGPNCRERIEPVLRCRKIAVAARVMFFGLPSCPGGAERARLAICPADIRSGTVERTCPAHALNGRKAFANDRSLPGAGLVGLRGTEASFPGRQATPLMGTPVTLPFSDNFSLGTDNNTQLSLAWQQQLGSFLLQGGTVKGNAGTSIATLFGLSVADVKLQADLSVSGNGSRAQLVARYSGPGDSNYYTWPAWPRTMGSSR
jgi:hypothetical protein